MIGVILHSDLQEIDNARLSWGIYLDSTIKNIGIKDIKYIVLCVSEKVRLVGRVSSVTCYPNVIGKPFFIEFSDFTVPSIIPSFKIGIERDEYVLINQEHVKELEKLFAEPQSWERPREIPLQLSIEEAVRALSARYGLGEDKIKISLHN